MATETGNQIQVAYIAETAFGTTPATPTGVILRKTGFTLAGEREFLENAELRTDRQREAGRGGIMVGRGELAGLLSYGTYDDFFGAALGGEWTSNVLKIGTIRKSFTVERSHRVNSLFFPFRGVVVDSFELSGTADANVEVKFGLIAKECGNEAAATLFTATTAANTNEIITTWSGSIKKGAATLGNVVSWSLKGENGFQEAKVCGSPSLYDLAMGTCKITGSVEVYFDSYALYTDYRAENVLAFQINLGPGASKSYVLDLTKCKITNHGAPSDKDGLSTVSFDFESYVDAANTALRITRVP